MSEIQKLLECVRNVLLTEAKKGLTYSDEHAFVHVWNHMVGKGIAHDKDAMHAELDKARTDKNHPLHFNNAKDDGFTGGKKTKDASDSYHEELRTALHSVHTMSKHPHFQEAIKKKHTAEVAGNTRGELTDTWKKYGAGNATSKSDVTIGGKHGLKVSMKKGTGSQLMSSGPEELMAVHHAAADRMLSEHPTYKNLPDAKKKQMHKQIMDGVKKSVDPANAARDVNDDKHYDSKMEVLKNQAQGHIDKVHDKFPELNDYVRREATTGEGKFGESSPHAATYMLESAHGKTPASIKHVSEIDHSGPRIRTAMPKSRGKGRSLNFKLDKKAGK